MSEIQNNYNIENDEITIKDLIISVKKYFLEVVQNWKIILLFIIPIALFMIKKAYDEDIVYRDSLTFMLNDDNEKGGLPGLGSLLGGLSLGGGNNETGLEKIMQLFMSRKVIDNALLDSMTVNGKADYLANHFLEIYGHEKVVKEFSQPGWKKEVMKKEGFRFKHNKVEDFDYTEEVMLRTMYHMIVGDGDRGLKPMLNTELNEKSAIMKIKIATWDEELTIETLKIIYKNLSEFFINKSVEKQSKTFNIVHNKLDSIQNRLAIAEYGLADFKDSNRKLTTVKGYLKEMQLIREVKILNVMNTEAIKNLEMADFALRSKTPYVQSIDIPLRPINPSKRPYKNNVILSIILGGFLGTVYIIGRRIIKDAMSDSTEVD